MVTGTDEMQIWVCLPCDSAVDETLPFMTVDEVTLEMDKDSTFKDEVLALSLAKRNKTIMPAAPVAEEVVAANGYTDKVKRKVTIVNDKEFLAALGFKPVQKTCRHYPQMEVEAEDGSGPERVWIFQYDPTSPYRSYSRTWFRSATSSKWLMGRDHFKFPSQAVRTFAWAKQDQETKAKMDVKDWKRLRSIAGAAKAGDVSDEEFNDVVKRPQSNAGMLSKPRRGGVPMRKASTDSIVGSSPEKTAVCSEQEDEDEEASADGDTPPPTLRRAASGIFADSACARAQARARSRRASTLAAAAEGAAPEPSAKSVDESAVSESGVSVSNVATSEGSKVARWMSKTSLVAAMTVKNGVNRWHAGELIKSLSRPEARDLTKHLDVYDAALNLHPDKIFVADDVDIATAVNKVTSRVALPASVKLNLVKRRADQLKERAYDFQGFQDLYRVVKPWCTPGDMSFTADEPQLKDLELAWKDRFQVFLHYIIAGVVQDCIDKAALRKDMILSISDFLIAEMEGLATNSELPLEQVSTVCEVMGACQNLRFVWTEPSDWTDDSCIQKIDDLHALVHGSNAPESASHCLGTGLSLSPFYSARVDEYVRQKPVLLQHGHNMWGIYDQLREAESGDVADPVVRARRMDVFQGLVKNLPIVLYSIPGSMGDRYKEVSEKFIVGFVEAIVGEDSNEKLPTPELKTLCKLLGDAQCALPFNADFQYWLERAGTLHRESEENGLSAILLNAMTVFLDASPPLDEHLDALTKAGAGVRGLQPSPETIAKAPAIFEKLLKMVNDNFSVCKPGVKCIELMGSIFGAEVSSVPRLVASFDAMLVARETLHELRAATGVADFDGVSFDLFSQHDQLLSKMLVDIERLKGATSTVETVAKDWTTIDGVWRELEALGNIHTKIRRGVGEARLETENVVMRNLKAELTKMLGGLPDGSDWLDALEPQDRTNWPKVLTIAGKTLLKEKTATGAKSAAEKLHEAPPRSDNR